ncbi:RagB/SusD family nutrient uptake outer membrane protein [Draconibacterium sp. IB214405]|uniref:RagB/SusD family nutrient uptake outer membrane protein n=1 Tax=Draconibacterium sp. IB214405 TaxID=3097352 RepID=UPI002A150440|nr:RagB/SusD family nutrient uptake outer membrane protein [Draconibacterium sp. IB214405]MDX8339666.1 RagB/SusD family nutrient uptake outer membrane protein [Draconibacterium sp. IB214405]
MKTLNILSKLTIVFLFIASINACTTDDLDPSTEQNKPVEGGIESDANLYGIVKGAYSRMTASGYYGRDYIINNEVRTDNCFSNGNSGRFTTQAGFNYSENTGFFWDEAYRVIASANIVIGVNPDEMTGDVDYIKHMQGQAYVLRGLVHFDLLKQYGQQNAGGSLGVPYVTEFKGEDLTPARKSVDECVTMILADLEMGYSMLNEDYDDSPEFITKYAPKAIASSVGVYFKKWDVAKSAAEVVINSGMYSIIPADQYVSSFGVDASPNSIFELAFSSTDNVGINGLAYIYRTTGGGSYGDVQVLDEVADLYDEGDVREGILGMEDDMLRNIGKYPDNQGYDNVGVIRYEEVLLNYAEAQLETGGDALTPLNQLAAERGIDAYTEVTKDILIDERRKELIFEGRRYDDLVRTGSDIEKISLQQNFAATIPYGDYRMAWPIPKAEMDANSNMVQNDNY